MDYTIREVDLDRPEIADGVHAVLKDAFGEGGAPSSSTWVKTVTGTTASQPSLHLAATLGDEVIGYNAFISHDLIYEGRLINCYQSCFTATSSRHRGKKIFQNLIQRAHDILRPRGAAFVFGFPNDNSYPLFTTKLGYRELPSLKIDILNIPVYRSIQIQGNPPSLPGLQHNAILQNDAQLIELKRCKYGADLLRAEFEGSIAWGLRRTTVRRGVHVPYLDIGGIELKTSEHLAPVVQRLRRQAGWIAYIQAITIEGNSLNGLFRKVASAHTNCLIVYDLNMKTDEGVTFNFFNGVRDVY